MERIEITSELLKQFRQKPQTLIMEGYCVNVENTAVYRDGDNYAAVSKGLDGGTAICVDTENTKFIDELLSEFCGRIEFCGASTFVTDYLKNKYEFLWETNCDLYVWNGEDLPPICEGLPAMDVKYAKQISDGTPYHAAEENIAECLRIHPSSAIYVENRPVCWCLMHIEGSLGMLYTVPQYRRQGYALKVMTDLTRKVIAQGNVPYAYIIYDNVASKSLALKYNLQPVCKANYFELDTAKNNVVQQNKGE